jgi:hypothetical protein
MQAGATPLVYTLPATKDLNLDDTNYLTVSDSSDFSWASLNTYMKKYTFSPDASVAPAVYTIKVSVSDPLASRLYTFKMTITAPAPSSSSSSGSTVTATN